MIRLVITNARIVTPEGSGALRGEAMGRISVIENGAVAADGEGRIVYAGPTAELPAQLLSEAETTVDAGGRVLLPGFVDSHTHLIFGGYRPDEFQWRLSGDTYMSIMERGGGIQSTVNATRTESARELADKAQWFLDRMSQMGVTTVEAKTGYGLDTATELKMLDAISMLAEKPGQRVGIVPAFMPAHAGPKEY